MSGQMQLAMQRTEKPARRLGRFLTAQPLADGCWRVVNRHKQVLGVVEHEHRWSEYVFEPTPGAVFSHECLRELAGFLASLRKEGA